MAKLDQIEIDSTLYDVVPEIAPLFNTSTAYAVGDCVIKDAVLYRFKTAHAAGAWIGTDADAIEVGEELTALKQELNQLESNIETSFSNVSLWEQGTITIGNGSTSSSNTRIRTKDYVPTEVTKVISSNASNYVFYILAWNSQDTYVGGWNGNGFGKTSDDVYLISDIEFKNILTSYPGYKFKLIGRHPNSSETISTSDATNYTFIKDNYVKAENIDDIISQNVYNKTGLCWNWWIRSSASDKWGNEYIGYISEDGYVGVLKRYTDGSTEYAKLGKSYNNDDHNGLAVLILSDGRVLCVGSGGHGINNAVFVYRSKDPYSITAFDDYSFTINNIGNYSYRLTYSQPYLYNGTIYNFLRCHTLLSNADDATGYICLTSSDNGETWNVYTAFCDSDAYITFSEVSDENGLLRFIAGSNPTNGANTKFYGGFVNLSNGKITDMEDTEIGSLATLVGSVNVASAAVYNDMTVLANQRDGSKVGRLFTCAKTEKAHTIFLMAHSDDAQMLDFTYELYNDGDVTSIGKSGVPFGNYTYISGICFGCLPNQVYYSKALTEKADGAHELHFAVIGENTVNDSVIHTSSKCLIRPLYCASGVIAVSSGCYNDQKNDGTYNQSFTSWNLSPLFV